MTPADMALFADALAAGASAFAAHLRGGTGADGVQSARMVGNDGKPIEVSVEALDDASDVNAVADAMKWRPPGVIKATPLLYDAARSLRSLLVGEAHHERVRRHLALTQCDSQCDRTPPLTEFDKADAHFMVCPRTAQCATAFGAKLDEMSEEEDEEAAANE